MREKTYENFKENGPDPEVMKYARRVISEHNIRIPIDGEVYAGSDILNHMELRTRAGFRMYGLIKGLYTFSKDRDS